MFDYRLFFASSTFDSTECERRRLLGHDTRRVYRLPAKRSSQRRSDGRR